RRHRHLEAGGHVAHEVATGPAVGAFDLPFERLVGELVEGLVGAPRLALLLQKFERGQVHHGWMLRHHADVPHRDSGVTGGHYPPTMPIRRGGAQESTAGLPPEEEPLSAAPPV